MNYESPQLRAVTGLAIRPGGVELTGRAMEFCSFPAGAQILDVGCGEGATIGYLRNQHRLDATGVDISSRLLRDGKSRDASLPLIRASAERLPYGNESLDGILCECALSLVPDPQCALAEFHRALRPGGRLILGDIYLRESGESRSTGEHVVDGCLKGAVPYSVTKSMLEETGFTVLLWEDHTRHLKELAARLVLAGAASAGFCGEYTKAGGGHQRPGYYLLVARKD
ncbi:MAG TPA: class I SAM-dependent methyltransferase [Geobacteraceae bacterium]